MAHSLFFTGKRIAVRHPLRQSDGLSELEGTAKPVFVFWTERPSGSEGEIRGEFWDLGRMQEGDSRFSSYDFRGVLAAANNGRWPGRDQVFVILSATFVPGPAPSVPTIRSIAMAPEKFVDRSVRLVGRFKGRNLYADLPQGVAKSRWDFVLQSADAALWVAGVRPKGANFDLDPGARVDTGRWLEVTGTVRRDGAALWIAGESVRVATAPGEPPMEVAVAPTPQQPPPAVIFSAPLAGETDVAVAGRIRIQFSRDMNAETLRGRVRIRYAGPNPSAAAPPSFTVTYQDATRSIEILFKEPLERLQVLEVHLEEGITAIDGQPLRRWTLTFTSGS